MRDTQKRKDQSCCLQSSVVDIVNFTCVKHQKHAIDEQTFFQTQGRFELISTDDNFVLFLFTNFLKVDI